MRKAGKILGRSHYIFYSVLIVIVVYSILYYAKFIDW